VGSVARQKMPYTQNRDCWFESSRPDWQRPPALPLTPGRSLTGKGARLESENDGFLTRATNSPRRPARAHTAPRLRYSSRPRSSIVELPVCTREASVQFRTWAPGFRLLVDALHAIESAGSTPVRCTAAHVAHTCTGRLTVGHSFFQRTKTMASTLGRKPSTYHSRAVS
jgi:hypothetical protein